MIDFSSLSSSKAEPLNEIAVTFSDVRFTFTESVDERKLYSELNNRLTALETSLEIDKSVLASVLKETNSFRVESDEKEELLLRIDWLHRLFEVKEAIQTVDSKESAEQLRSRIASVQTCPMKNELTANLDSLIESLPSEQVDQSQLSPEQKLMEQAIEEAGNDFINLGKAGRENIVQKALEEFGNNVSIDYLQEATKSLEQQVDRLAELRNEEALQVQLDNLPLPHYANLSAERKQMVTKQLLEKRNWKGLASLDRMILHLDSALAKAEEQEMQKIEESGIATSLDFKRLGGLAIQVR